MMASDRLFFKLHNGFPEHPKAFELSDKAFRQLIEAWCYCSRNLNDGKLTKAQFSKLFSRKSQKELMSVGFLKCTDSGYEMHDYLDHQQSAEEVKTLRTARSMAGSKGGKARASAIANAKQEPKQTGSKPVADIDTDTDTDMCVPASRKKPAVRLPASWAPNEAHAQYAKDEGIALDFQAERFRTHAEANDRRIVSWDAAFRNWLLKAERAAPPKPAASSPWSKEFHK